MSKSILTYGHLLIAVFINIVKSGDGIRCYTCSSYSEDSDCFRRTTSIKEIKCPQDMPFCTYTENREPWIFPNSSVKSPLVQVILGCGTSPRKQNCLYGKYCTWKTCYTDFCNCYTPDCTNSTWRARAEASRRLCFLAAITAIACSTFQRIFLQRYKINVIR